MVKEQTKQTKEGTTVYLLKLHEYTWLEGNMRVLRVPGGWIYTRTLDAITFVPFDNEFQKD